ncbi:glycine-rich domain-containing protein [Variovorax sp. W6]|uniref:glycine-rich domain-containing protein n=1 Tax=Variovorax sp. W6 TaxID=3093895 RepID=UPI003D808EC3
MTDSTHSKTLEQTIAAIHALDLTPIKFKACRKEDGYGWSASYADQMEVAYKRYLILHARHSDLTLAPDQDVDRFWHMHILDTRKYAADCEATFGYFLHHFPYLGLRGEEDAKALEAAFLQMQRLLAEEFGEPMPRHAVAEGSAAWCSLEAGKASAAWCSLEAGKASAAWCSLEAGKPQAAWCSLEAGKPSAAWCSLEAGKPQAAWCSLEAGKASAAWCSLDKEGAVVDPALTVRPSAQAGVGAAANG